MKKLPTLREAKERYFLQLESLTGDASLDELNELSNQIHNGVSQHGCGVWHSDQKEFTSCQHENCQMLAECLTLYALMPQGRTDFLTFVFNGNSERHQRQEIADVYFQSHLSSLKEHERNQHLVAYYRLLDQKQYWTSVEMLDDLIQQQIKTHSV